MKRVGAKRIVGFVLLGLGVTFVADPWNSADGAMLQYVVEWWAIAGVLLVVSGYLLAGSGARAIVVLPATLVVSLVYSFLRDFVFWPPGAGRPSKDPHFIGPLSAALTATLQIALQRALIIAVLLIAGFGLHRVVAHRAGPASSKDLA